MKKIIKLVFAAMFLSVFTTAHATLIDFESFVGGQNIHGLNLGGVTLTANAGNVQVLANNASGGLYRSPVNSITTFDDFILTGTFDSQVSFVSLWAGDEGFDIDSWELEAFDATVGGNSLGLVSQGDWTGNPYTNLSISAANILRFEARWTGNQFGIAWDDLEFEQVPEPTSLALLGLGLVGLGFARKRK